MSNLKATPLATNSILDPVTDAQNSAKKSTESAIANVDAPATHEYLLVFPSSNHPNRLADNHGRARNPVPSKLKGKTDSKNGNFAVMHMNMPTPEPVARRAAPNQANEETEHTAAWDQRSESHERKQSATMGANQKPLEGFAEPNPPAEGTSSFSMPKKPQQKVSSPLEVKEEQTRLLGLLRNLQPEMVVDQICKALTYFGGVPGAQPPADGVFPESTAANGYGPQFVSWLAEIFPKDNESFVDQIDLSLPPRRRGRPKGSKSTKVRKDKGLRKRRPTDESSTLYEAGFTPSGTNPRENDSEWIDLEQDSDNERHQVHGHAGRNTGTSKAQSRVPLDPENGDVTAEEGGMRLGSSALLSAPSGLLDEESVSSGIGGQTDQSIPALKRRGRPKGSKNRPKNSLDNNAQDDTGGSAAGILSEMVGSSSEPRRYSSNRKPGPGRPRGSKNRIKQVTDELTRTGEETSPAPDNGVANTFPISSSMSDVPNIATTIGSAEPPLTGPSAISNSEHLSAANGHGTSHGPKRKSMDEQRPGIGMSDFRLLGRELGPEESQANDGSRTNHHPSVKRRRISNAQAQMPSVIGDLHVDGIPAYRRNNGDTMSSLSRAPMPDATAGIDHGHFQMGLEQGRRAVAGASNTRSTFPSLKQQQQRQSEQSQVQLSSAGTQPEMPATTYSMSPANRVQPFHPRTSPSVNNRPGLSEPSADQQHAHMGAAPPALHFSKSTTPGSYQFLPRMVDGGNRGLPKESEYPVRRTHASSASGSGQFHVNPANDSMHHSPRFTDTNTVNHVSNHNLQRFHGYGNPGYINVTGSGSGEHQDHMGIVTPHHYSMSQTSVQGNMPSQAFETTSRMPHVNFDVTMANQGLRDGLYPDIDRR